MRIHAFVGVAAAVLAGAVTGHSQVPAAGRAAQPSTRPAVTFAETIAPIVYANCVTCHRPGEAAPFSLITYEDVVKRGKLVARVTSDEVHAAVARGSGAWRVRRRAPADRGADRGDRQPGSRAACRVATRRRCRSCRCFRPTAGGSGSRTSSSRCRSAFDLPASGPDVFRNFVIPTGLTEDKWVRGVEFRPERPQGRASRDLRVRAGWTPGGARRRRRPAGLRRDGDRSASINDRGDSRGLGGWAVGATPMMFPEGLAARLPKGSDFLLQMHFHLTGKPETREVAHRDLLRGPRAGQGRVLGRAAGALRLRRRHRHRAGREAVTRFRTRSRCRAMCASTRPWRTRTTWPGR